MCIIVGILIYLCCKKAITKNEKNVTANNIITITIPEKFEGLSGMNEQELCEYFKKNGNGNYDSIDVFDNQVRVSLNEEQVDYWKDYAKELVKEQEKTLTNVSSRYKASYSDSYDVINVYYDTMISFKKAFNYVGKAAIYCAMYQLFNGKEDYSLSLNVCNVDTGKIVASGNLEQDDVSYDDAEWKQSYVLNSEEVIELTSSYNSSDIIKIKSTFTDGISVINILQSSAGNDYQYIYLDENDTVFLNIADSQKDNMINKMNQYLSSIKKQFENLGDGYEISCNSDFSKIDYKFDENLSKQDQSNYFINVETIGMINQLLKGNGSNYYIELNIYNSATNKLISSGDTNNGVTWNIGE